MCGIVGYVGKGRRVIDLLEALRRLEYRGYDSAGIAFLSNGEIEGYKKKGKIIDLMAEIPYLGREVKIAIGHTRWATHGVPDDKNAHPHTDCKRRIAVVHNGIIENHQRLRSELEKKGHIFKSDTDTEVIAHLIEEELASTSDPLEAFRRAILKLRGAFAIAVIFKDKPDAIFFVRKENPLILGLSEGEVFIASDSPAFLPYTKKAIFLNDGYWGIASASQLKLYDWNGNPVTPKVKEIPWDISTAEKGGYKHFMLKEIFEQPRILRETMEGRLGPDDLNLEIDIPVEGVREVIYVACGTSYHAGLTATYWGWEIAGIPSSAITASEFRYLNKRKADLSEKLFVFISQSGETADTLTAMRSLKKDHPEAKAIGVTNVMGSSLERELPSLLIRAGLEIGVAATKTFTAQLYVLLMLNLKLALAKGTITKDYYRAFRGELLSLPKVLEDILARHQEYFNVADKYTVHDNFLYLGRHLMYPIAMEGALKLKEISYIHAEAYPAGEMKHGPIAMIDQDMPSMLLIPYNSTTEKMISNLKEIKARQGKVVALIDTKVDMEFNLSGSPEIDHVLKVPYVNTYLQPLVATLPLQLFAYRIADFKGLDVDQPRNLAKSVTVE